MAHFRSAPAGLIVSTQFHVRASCSDGVSHGPQELTSVSQDRPTPDLVRGDHTPSTAAIRSPNI